MLRKKRTSRIKGITPRHSRLAIAFMSVAWGIGALAAPASAQRDPAASSYLTPFPKNDVYRLRVVGDTLAEGLNSAISESLARDARIRHNASRWWLNRLLSSRFDKELTSLKNDLRRDDVNIVIVMLGTRDRRYVRNRRTGKRAYPGTAPWRNEVSSRADALMRALKELKISVYWVGMPNLRGNEANEVARLLNEVFRERAYLNGIKFIDAFTSFADEQGGYSAYGPDLTGKIRLLRERDGVHLTYAGNRKLAHFVERELKRDMAQAKAERAMPLAGNEYEQSRISPDNEKSESEKAADWRTTIAAKQTEGDTDEKQPTSQPTTGPARGEQQEDHGRIALRSRDTSGQEKILELKILRPAIPASVVALVTRKQSPDRLSRQGEMLIDQIAGGLNIISTVTPANEELTAGSRRKLSPAQRAFFRVLVRGERTTPRTGRADDFSWPRPEPPPLPKLTKTPEVELPKTTPGGVPLPTANPIRPRA